MKGIDLCWHENGDPNNIISSWRDVKESGIDFVILRDGWGTDKRDAKLIEYSQNAQNADIAVLGVYHFVYAISLQEAIQNAIRAVQNVKKAGLPKSTIIWCDIEGDTVQNAKDRGVELTNKMLREFAEAFCNYCYIEGYATGIYLNKDYLLYRYGEDILKEYDIWFADPDDIYNYPCLIKQNDWYGKVKGITGNVDCNTWIGNYTAGTAKKEEKDMSHIVYTEKQLTDILRTLASGKSSYSNVYPKNLLYWDGQRWWADCSNLYKALFNGRSIVNPKVGSYQSDLSNTGDCTEWGLMQQCTDRSSDFTKLGNQFRCLYMDGHFGGYLGFEWNEPNQGIVNCVESTPRWEGGIQFSYVGSNGSRSWAKGTTVNGYWTVHGLATPWISYNSKQETSQEHKDMTRDVFTSFMPLLQKGSENDFVALLQKCLRYTGYYTDVIDGSFGNNTFNAVKAFQSANKLYVDGIAGKQTWNALLSK